MNIYLEKVATSQKNILGNLLEYYVYEFSSYLDLDFNAEGKYGFDPLEQYFSESCYYPYFIRGDEQQYLGFVIVKQETGSNEDTLCFSIDQFFVAKKYSGQGIGKCAAKQAFEAHQGFWRVTQIQKNKPAQAFWRRTIHDYTQGNYMEYYDDQRRSVQEFDHPSLKL